MSERLRPWWVAEGLGKYAKTDELLALRARVGQLEAALKRADLLIMDGFPDGAHVEIRAAIEDTPQ